MNSLGNACQNRVVAFQPVQWHGETVVKPNLVSSLMVFWT